MFSSRVLAPFALAAVMVIFGLTFVAVKICLRDLGPYVIAFTRFMIATVALSCAAWRSRSRVHLGELPWARLSLMGVLGVTLFFSLQNLGLTYTSASSASLILSSVPAATAVVSFSVLREVICRVRALSIMVSMGGVSLIVLGGGEGVPSLGGSLIGDLLILGCAFVWAGYTVISRSLAGRLPYLTVTLVSTALGTLFLAPAAVYEYFTSPPMRITPPSAASLLFLGLIASGFAFLLYNFALGRLEASEASMYVNLSPLVTVCAANLILHETISPLQLVGGIVVLSSIYLAGKTPSNRSL